MWGATQLAMIDHGQGEILRRARRRVRARARAGGTGESAAPTGEPEAGTRPDEEIAREGHRWRERSTKKKLAAPGHIITITYHTIMFVEVRREISVYRDFYK